ncbi:MAG: Holliday junction resolvase RuvX [Rhodospirillales bacterium]
MPVLEPLALKAALPRNRRLLGLDVGEKTIGLAISDRSLTVASPLETIRRSKFTADAARLAAICVERAVGGLVVGLPMDMRGVEGRRCQSVRQFAANLLAKIDLPLAFWDERLSTVAVTRALIEADMSRARRGQVVDKAAAAYILQGLLDRLAAADKGPPK